jgi:transposase
MAKDPTELTDEQWRKLEPLLPKLKASPKGGPKPIGNRPVFEGILWVLRSGARWKDLPDRYPSSSTCWRRLRLWEEQGVWQRVWRVFIGELDAQGLLDWEETFADGSFAPAKRGARASARPNAARVRSGWWWWTAKVFLSEAAWRLPRRRK